MKSDDKRMHLIQVIISLSVSSPFTDIIQDHFIGTGSIVWWPN